MTELVVVPEGCLALMDDLQTVVEAGLTDVVKVLLDSPLLTHVDPYCLSVACDKGHYDIVKLLLEAGVPANAQYPILNAAYRERADIIELLVSFGADPDAAARQYIHRQNDFISLKPYLTKE